MYEYIAFGIIAGFVGGFFGVGGGMILVPMLLFSDFSMKQAVSISVMQMVFTSIFGSFINYKKNKNILKDGLLLGFGGFGGGLFSGIIVSIINNQTLSYIFMSIVLFAIYRIGKTSTINSKKQIKTSAFYLIVTGFFIGSIAMSIGVGGSVMLIPILVSFLYYDFKHASSLGLFFVVFSSTAGFISLSLANQMLYKEGAIIGCASLIGVYLGIITKNNTNIKSYKFYILSLYILIFASMVIKKLV
jgi:uncharacterized membrane protein YfcA